MGWQSHVLGYSNDEEKQKILDVIKDHNNATDEMWHNHEVGEEIVEICEAEFTKPYKKGLLKNKTHAILCGNGGGRTSTFNYFYSWYPCYVPYTKAIDNRLNMKDMISHTKNYNSEAPEEIVGTAGEYIKDDDGKWNLVKVYGVPYNGT